ncbi:MAG: hypothetical protein AB7V46_08985 [Thermomicrobiales bacterium]
MRRLRMGLLLYVVASMVVLAGSVASARVTNAQILQSGALGLTRDQFEATWGPPTAPVDLPAMPVSETMYLYGAEDAMIYVAYRQMNGEEIAVYVEFDWLGDGISHVMATETVERLLPADAVLTEVYGAPPTPEGPISLQFYRYVSETFGASSDGVLSSEILVMEQHAWNDAAGSSTITSISLMIRERTQLTG